MHKLDCASIGDRNPSCDCPRRLAYSTVAGKVSQLKDVLEKQGYKGRWNSFLQCGNPVDSDTVGIFLSQIKREQSMARVCPKQALPIFMDKLALVFMYIDRRLGEASTPPIKRFILARDQALLKLRFFGGDRANDAGLMLTQEIKALPGGAGIVIRHTWGKTFRLDKANVFSLFRCKDEMFCPVKAIETYIEVAKSVSVDVTRGYLFRPVSAGKYVEDKPFSAEASYGRLKYYLSLLQIDSGETPHSLRAGCAIALRSKLGDSSVEPAGKELNVVGSHVGWFSQGSVGYYTRSAQVDQASALSKLMAGSEGRLRGEGYVDISSLGKAF